MEMWITNYFDLNKILLMGRKLEVCINHLEYDEELVLGSWNEEAASKTAKYSETK